MRPAPFVTVLLKPHILCYSCLLPEYKCMREVDIMDAGYTYYIVSARVLPEAMRRTAEAKRLLRSGEAKTAAGRSRCPSQR